MTKRRTAAKGSGVQKNPYNLPKTGRKRERAMEAARRKNRIKQARVNGGSPFWTALGLYWREAMSVAVVLSGVSVGVRALVSLWVA